LQKINKILSNKKGREPSSPLTLPLFSVPRKKGQNPGGASASLFGVAPKREAPTRGVQPSRLRFSRSLSFSHSPKKWVKTPNPRGGMANPIITHQGIPGGGGGAAQHNPKMIPPRRKQNSSRKSLKVYIKTPPFLGVGLIPCWLAPAREALLPPEERISKIIF